MMKSQPITAATEPESQNQAAKDKAAAAAKITKVYFWRLNQVPTLAL